MRLVDRFRFCFQALARNRFRSTMLLLSMSIGVASVVILTGLGEGARQFVLGEFSALGKNVLVVLPGRKETTGGLPPVTGSAVREITLADAQALSRLPGVERVAPIVVGTADVSSGALNRESIVVGTTDDYFAIRNLDISAGSGLPDDSSERAAVAVIGRTVVADL
ncbi:MAG: ABC transporter permease, partial [Proteobacteria bacterium]